MKKIRVTIIIIMAMLSLFSCNKDKSKLPAFSATGYWKGDADPGAIALLNRPDGTSRLYLLETITMDTATALAFNGKYIASQDAFHFQSDPNPDDLNFHIETTKISLQAMSGSLLILLPSQGNTGITHLFTIIKQP